MLIFGHNLIKTDEFFKIKAEFKSGAVNCFEYDENVLKRALECKFKDEFKLGVFVRNQTQGLICNALGVSFILCESEDLASELSKMAEFYLFDSKILLIVSTLQNLENAYKLGVDGVILKSFIKE